MAASASKKKPSTRKPGRPRKDTRQQIEVQDSFIRAEVIILLSFAFAVLLFLSNFHLCGVLGELLRGIQLGIFGTLGFLVPILLFMGTCFSLSNRGNHIATVKLIAGVAAVLTLCGLMQLLFGQPFAEGQKLMQLYRDAAAGSMGGGWLGGVIAGGLSHMIGTPGAYVLLIVGLVISVVIITERSFVNAVKKGGDIAYKHTRENMERHAEAVAERRRLREEMRVRGVNLESTKIEEPMVFDQMLKEEEELLELEVRHAETAIRSVGSGYETDFDEEYEVSQPAAVSAAADVFTGSIAMPVGYIDDDTVPFAMDDDSELPGTVIPAAVPASVLKVPRRPGPEQAAGFDELPEEDGAGERGYYKDTLIADAEVPGINYDSFYIPEDQKQVVTAGGKIIETDTEELKKKLETRKKQVKADGSTSAAVSMEIKEKQAAPKKEYKYPPTSLLKRPSHGTSSFSDKEYKATAIKLQQTLRDFGVGVTVTNISCGPSVTRYELHPEQGVKVSRIVGLADDIKLSLAAEDIRIEAPIPGKSAVGIEVPNKENNTVFLRELLDSDGFKNSVSRLSFAVGKDIGGQVVVTDIAKMPHLLIAGATGSGKSVCINTLIMSIIFKASPEDVRLIMIDPKVVELSVYNGIPHLLIPVVTDPKKASGALNWAVAEMTDRYKKFAEYNVRDVKGYNAKVAAIKDIEDEKKPGKLPQIVIIVDELADLMMVAPGEVEDAICRLAQLARAAGIHLVIATQRPSVNVITGLIKANVPSRIAFSVSSGVDSRTIIDMNGAEKLLGKGDMLFYPAGFPKPQRVQGAFVSDQEVQKVVDFLTEQGMEAQYSTEVETQINLAPEAGMPGGGDNRDEYFVQAGRFIIEKEKASIGMLQRAFKIGFNRAARIMDQLCEAGVVGEEEGTKPRKVLLTMEEFEEIMNPSE